MGSFKIEGSLSVFIAIDGLILESEVIIKLNGK